jgi:glycosyltransferase involved in cell wall biosynthesis
VKLAIVVQRYGLTVNGGAELHARYVAERLARHAEVEVLTTCATDYVTWRNELPAGLDRVNDIAVRRFKVKHERDPLTFGRLSDRVFHETHSVGDELAWLDAEGPTSPALVDHLSKHAAEWDFCIFFSYRYYHAFHGIRAVASRAILVPTAERDSTIGLSLFSPIFRGVRGLMYNSPEEKAMIQGVSSNSEVPSVVVGVGSDVPPSPQPARFRQKYNIRGPYTIYVGRIDENKGCKELFGFFERYLRETTGQLTLALIGNAVIDIPSDPRIRHLGFVDDTDKFDAIAGAELLIMPSYYESLSMVALEAWALGRPVLANAKCDVLKGQCLRSNAGLWYDGPLEFVEAMHALERNKWVAASLGRNGRQFYRDHYDWPVIERKYLDMLARLSRAGTAGFIEPLPSWRERRRHVCPAGASVVAGLPSGPALSTESPAPRRDEPAPMPAIVSRPQPERMRPAAQGRDRRDDRRDRGRFRRGGSRPGHHR